MNKKTLVIALVLLFVGLFAVIGVTVVAGGAGAYLYTLPGAPPPPEPEPPPPPKKKPAPVVKKVDPPPAPPPAPEPDPAKKKKVVKTVVAAPPPPPPPPPADGASTVVIHGDRPGVMYLEKDRQRRTDLDGVPPGIYAIVGAWDTEQLHGLGSIQVSPGTTNVKCSIDWNKCSNE